MAKQAATNADVNVIEDVPVEVLATSIVKISETVKRMEASGLNRDALCALVKDATGIPKSTTTRVLNALRSLSATYTTQKSAK